MVIIFDNFVNDKIPQYLVYLEKAELLRKIIDSRHCWEIPYYCRFGHQSTIDLSLHKEITMDKVSCKIIKTDAGVEILRRR